MHDTAPKSDPLSEARAFLATMLAEARLIRDGFVEIPIRSDFLNFHATYAWTGLRRITEDRERKPYRIKDNSESGLTGRKDDERKYVFHYRKGLEADFRRRRAPVKRYEAFFLSCEALDTAAYEMALEVGRLFDRWNRSRAGYPGSLEERIREGYCITRILRYLPREGGAPDAKVHFDHACITVHWWSSHPGLSLFDRRGNPIKVAETSTDRIAVFTGRGFVGATRGVFGQGIPHGVRDPRRDGGSSGFGDRYAIVSFIHCALSEDDRAWMQAHESDFANALSKCAL